MIKNNQNDKDGNDEPRDKCLPFEGEEIDNIETTRIKRYIEIQTCWAEYGSVIKMSIQYLLDPKSYKRMRCEYVYGIISNCDGICDVNSSRVYWINWSIAHLYIGNIFIYFVAPFFEHDFEVVKFSEKVDRKEDKEFSK